MTNPFPGVNPYLEAQHRWSELHSKFVNVWQEQLLEDLPDGYDARLNEHVYLVNADDDSGRVVIPDVALDRASLPNDTTTESASDVYGGVATATLTAPPPWEVTEVFIEIIQHPDRELVAILELLSPTNKGSHYIQYKSKRNAILQSPAHLVELDLLVLGRKLPMQGELPPGRFHSYVSRAELPREFTVAGWGLRQRMPKIPIPLAGPEEEVVSDLQTVFDTAWQRGRYEKAIDYTKPLDLPLSDDDQQWVAEQLKSAASQDNHE